MHPDWPRGTQAVQADRVLELTLLDDMTEAQAMRRLDVIRTSMREQRGMLVLDSPERDSPRIRPSADVEPERVDEPASDL